MDPFSKKMFKEFEVVQQQTGRMLRSMSISRMMPMESAPWQPPVDIYESVQEIYVYADLAGVDPDKLEVIIDEQQLLLKGKRQLPKQNTIACIQQLEIELGTFERTVTLSTIVDLDKVSSIYTNGILVVTLSKRKKSGKVNIQITSGV